MHILSTAHPRLGATEVASNEEIAPGIFRLTFPREHDFIPGQTLALTTDPAIPARFYSIASGRSEPLIEILYDLVPDGQLTPRLARLAAGDVLLASTGFGAFSDGEGASVWIASGTGVAPFASMARSGILADKTLIHGSRTLAGLYLRGYFSSMLGGRYVPCCSTESADGVFPGRTTSWLASTDVPVAERYLLCGSSRMVVDVRDLLIARGVPFNRIVAEIYF
ncbi:MAG TPA: oxidoreductase [Spirochaetia bacterium]|nr:oxidoreductase [Spirochaetia bacterium]